MSTSEPTLDDAIQLALSAHRGQVDKAGQPYILHPLRVMFAMQDETARMVAVLHDVVEDSDLTLDDLRQRGYSQTVLDAVDALTRREAESYEAFVQRAKTNRIARRVKLADIEDNMDLRRLADLGERDVSRLRRYQAARAVLLTDA